MTSAEVPRRSPKRRRLSLELKLPLATTALLVVLLGLYIWIAYEEVAVNARTAAADRNARLASELGALTTNSSAARARLVSRIVNQPGVSNALATGRFETIDAAFDSLRLPTDSNFTIVVMDTFGRVLRHVGNQPHPEAWSRVAALLPAAAARDTLSVASPFFFMNQRAYFWSVASVRADRRLLGYVAQLRAVYTAPTARRTLEGLIGADNEILFANRDAQRDPLVKLDGTSYPEPQNVVREERGVRYDRGGKAFIAGRTSLQGTPWDLIVETPAAIASARPNQFLRRTGLLALLLLMTAAAGVWAGSRRITRPIRELNAAAHAIESGDLARRVNIQRADELGALGRSFNEMADEVQRSLHAAEESRVEAERANRTKSEFLANMSHEIRTPINAILGYTDLIDLGVSGHVTEEQHAQLERIRISGNHLIGLIDDLLDFARLDVASIAVEPRVHRADESIATAVTVVEPQARAKGVHLDVACDDNIEYLADPQRVEQILVNLLGNAVKFTESGGSVELHCGMADGGARPMVEFNVTDNGIGIPPDRLEAIFEPFVQAKGGYTRRHGGTGLGLSISRRLAELMGGAIDVESELGKGSHFTLKMPAASR
jgi:signal transduction histidine kinase